ncbi:MAG: MFS transporter [Hamadaea sp.]|nr:MFS transporter [Hamadaea sp.]NUT02934.1 MFS transporter [Hamadaea sp.]
MSRDFRMLALGQGLSWLGNGFQTVALAVAILLAGGGAGDLGLVMAASVVAMLAGTLFGGVWADRMQPQRVMVVSDIVRAAAATGIALVFGTGHYALPLIMVLAAASAGAGSFFGPAFTSLKPMLVPADQRQSANATLSLLQTSCAVLGPALGGLVVARFGATTGFTVNAISFVVSTVTALLIRVRVTRPPREGMLRELGAGWLEIRRRDWLLVGVLAATVYHIANGVVLVLVQVLAIERLGGASAAGLVAAAEGLGGVIGAAVGMRFKPRRLLRAGWLTLLLMPVWVLVYVWPGVLTAVAAGAVVGYAGLAFFSVAWDTALQDHIPHDRLARVASWDMLTSFLAMPIGNALAGPLASAFGYDPVLMVCALVLLGAGIAPLTVVGTRRLVRSTVEIAPAPRQSPESAEAGVPS